MNLTAAAIVFVLRRAARPATRTEPAAKAGEERLATKLGLPSLAGLSACSGLTVLAMELGWGRLARFLVGNRALAVSVLLCGVLLFLGAASLAAPALLRRARQLGLTSEQALGWALLLSALAQLLGAGATAWLIDSAPGSSAVGTGLFLLLMALPFFTSGLVFPWLLMHHPAVDAHPSQSVGYLYATNVVGSAAGSLLTTFALQPAVGTMAALALAGLVCAALGLVLALPGSGKVQRRAVLGSAAALALALVVFPYRLTPLPAGSTLIDAREDEYGIQVLSRGQNGLVTATNNNVRLVAPFPDANTIYAQHMQADPAMLLAASPRRVLNVGTGYGITAGAFSTWGDQYAQMVTIEILPFMVQHQPTFKEANYAYYEDPRVQLLAGDGRRFLSGSTERWDVIAVNPLDARLPGSSSLCTVDFWKAAKAKLDRGGVYTQLVWGPQARVLVQGFSQVFPRFLVLRAYGNSWVLVGMADDDPPVPAFRFERVTEPVRQAYRRFGITDLESFYGVLREIAEADTARWTSGLSRRPEAVLHSNDRPILEYDTRFGLLKNRRRGLVMRRFWAISLLAILSGCFGINYEVVYFRLITSRFGDMLHVQAAILATFLLGIALGARLSRRFTRWLWLMEVLVGVSAVAIHATLGQLDTSPALSGISRSGPLTVAVCALLVFPPALLVGMSVPIFSKYLSEVGGSDQRRGFKATYLLYNLGAMASVFLVEFVVVRALGHEATLFAAAAGNVLVGLALFALFPELRQPRPEPAATAAAPPLDARRLWGVLLVGVASSMFQIFFSRLAMEMVGPSRSVFTLSLSLVLLGLPLGTLLARRLKLGAVVVLAASAAILSLVLAPLAVEWLTPVRASLVEARAAPLTVALFDLAGLALLGLVPFTAFGAVLPVVLGGESTSQKDVASAMLFCGLGNSAGYLLQVMLANWLLPELGQVLLVAGVALAGLAVASGPGRSLNLRALAAPVACALALVVSFEPSELYRHHFPLAEFRLDPELKGPLSLDFRMERRSGADAALVSARNSANELIRSLFYLGHTSIVASTAGKPQPSEVLSGVLPAIWAPPGATRACVLGIGTGITAGTTAQLFEHTDAVEINAAVLALLPGFDEDNFGLRTNPRATVVHDDARVFLLHSPQAYDVVLNSVSVPNFGTAAKIYTREFFERAKKALRPGGVYLTWVGLGMNDEALLSVLGALQTTFQRCAATHLDFGYDMLACSDGPLRPRPFVDLQLPEAVRAALAPVGGPDLARAIDASHLADDVFASLDPKGLVNTDDFPVAEFASADFRIGATALQAWLSTPDLLGRDLFSAKPLTPDRKVERCFHAHAELAQKCLKEMPQLREGWKRFLLTGAAGDAAEKPAWLRRRLHFTRALHTVAPGDPDVTTLLSRLARAFAVLEPDDATANFEAARRSIEPESPESQRFLYRAIVLDQRYRRLVTR
ncbi:MAG: hypothetical protein QM765_41430 [Myxococcales bacterium]